MLTPFCDETEWEENVKDKSKAEALAGQEEDEKCATPVAAKTLCIPFEQPELPAGTKPKPGGSGGTFICDCAPVIRIGIGSFTKRMCNTLSENC